MSGEIDLFPLILSENKNVDLIRWIGVNKSGNH